jgi:hypothetical protein
MLVIANGAYKSGSNWLLRIVQELTGYALPPEPFVRPGWGGTGVPPEKLAQFLDEVDYAGNGYLMKSHLFFKMRLVANRPNVKILNITRDLRDVVVSAFHYEQLKGKQQGGDFAEYYWRQGRHTAHYVTHYNRLWATVGNAFAANYEALQSEFATETRRVVQFLGLNVSDDAIERARSATTLKEMRAKYNDVSADGKMQFYRKGVVGDWQNHFDDAMLRDIERIQRRHAYYPNLLDKMFYRYQCWRRPDTVD